MDQDSKVNAPNRKPRRHTPEARKARQASRRELRARRALPVTHDAGPIIAPLIRNERLQKILKRVRELKHTDTNTDTCQTHRHRHRHLQGQGQGHGQEVREVIYNIA